MRIVTKMIIGYVLLVCIPFLGFGYMYYYQLYHNYYTQLLTGQQGVLEQAVANMEINLGKTEATFQMFENNIQLIAYLQGELVSDEENIYTYLTAIYPTFIYGKLSNPLVNNIRIYKYNEKVFSIKPYIESIDDLDPDVPVANLSPNQGLWLYRDQGKGNLPQLTYYHMLYNDSYTNPHGVIEVDMNDAVFEPVSQPLDSEGINAVMLADSTGKISYVKGNHPFSMEQLQTLSSNTNKDAEFYAVGDQWLVNSDEITSLNLRVIRIRNIPSMLNYLSVSKRWIILVGLAALLLLSMIYYYLASTVVRRIVGLSKHMKKIGENNFKFYDGPVGKDEIGFLIQSYNIMIDRIDDLIKHMHRVQMLKKDADYKMLQAQIRPHFLYNSLEAIRACAEINNDTQAADMAFHLGEFFRYSLAQKANAETTLESEIDHLTHYLAIYKVRMRDRLTFDIQVKGDVSSFSCPRFILQPLVENCLIHGLAKKRGNGRIKIVLTRLAQGVHIIISDNGVGIEAPMLKLIQNKLDGNPTNDITDLSRLSGIALHNVKERISAYYSGYSEFVIESEAGRGTIIEMTLGHIRGERHVSSDDS